MLSSTDRLYFIHIPKTAGTSLIPLLDMHFHHDEIFPAQLWYELAQIPSETINQYRFFRGHFGGNGLDPFLSSSPLTITMLRDPVSLSLSTYEFILREPGTRVHKIVTSRGMSFEDFLNYPKTRSKISNKQVNNLSFYPTSDPNADPILLSSESRSAVDKWIRSNQVKLSPKERLERAVLKLEHCAFFGLVERFNDSMALMSYTFGWSPIDRIQKLRVSENTQHRAGLSDLILKKVETCNTLDRILYRYAETLFNKRVMSMKHQLLKNHDPEGRLDISDLDDHSILFQLLDQHYQSLYEKQGGENKKSIVYTFKEALYGQGWQRREIAPYDNSFFRWTGPGTFSTLDLNVDKSSDLIITIKLLNTIDPRLLETFRIHVDNCELVMRSMDDRKSVFQGFIHQEQLNHDLPFVRVTLTVDFTASPKQINPGNPDDRQLGLAVNWIHVSKADMPDSEQLLNRYPNRAVDSIARLLYKNSFLRRIYRLCPERVKRIIRCVFQYVIITVKGHKR